MIDLGSDAARLTSAQHLRLLLSGPEVVRLPGVFDAVSAAIAAQVGAQAVSLSGAAVSAVELGLPDLGFVHGSDIAARAMGLRGALGEIPILADADTGYGNALQAAHTVRRYADAGIAGLHLEDQVSPKRCGHLGGKAVVDVDEAAARVRAAVDAAAQCRNDLVIVARTDALSVHGREEVVKRCRAFAEAGADAVFVEGAGLGDLAAVHDALTHDQRALPQMFNRSEAGGPLSATPTDADLAAVGVRLVIYPVSPLLAAAQAVRRVVGAIVAGEPSADVPRMGWTDLTDLLGLPALLHDEQSYAVSPHRGEGKEEHR